MKKGLIPLIVFLMVVSVGCKKQKEEIGFYDVPSAGVTKEVKATEETAKCEEVPKEESSPEQRRGEVTIPKYEYNGHKYINKLPDNIVTLTDYGTTNEELNSYAGPIKYNFEESVVRYLQPEKFNEEFLDFIESTGNPIVIDRWRTYKNLISVRILTGTIDYIDVRSDGNLSFAIQLNSRDYEVFTCVLDGEGYEFFEGYDLTTLY